MIQIEHSSFTESTNSNDLNVQYFKINDERSERTGSVDPFEQHDWKKRKIYLKIVMKLPYNFYK